MADQACELAAATKTLPPQATLSAHPQDDDVATVVRWPIAALPTNSLRSKGGFTPCAAANDFSTPFTAATDSATPFSQHWEPAPTFIADFGMALAAMSPADSAALAELARPPCSNYPSERSAKPFLQSAPVPAAQLPRRTSKDPSSENRSLLARSSWPSPPPTRDRQSNKQQRPHSTSAKAAQYKGGMPTSFSGLSQMFPGAGGGNKEGSANNAHRRRHTVEPREVPREPKVPTGARAMPTNLDGLSLMLSGGGRLKASQQQAASSQEPAPRRKRGSSTRRREGEAGAG